MMTTQDRAADLGLRPIAPRQSGGTTVKVRRMVAADGSAERKGTWCYALCVECLSGEIKYRLDTPARVAELPAVVRFICRRCAGSLTSWAPPNAILTDLGKHRIAHWGPCACVRCANAVATHFVRVFPAGADYPAVAFICAACLTPTEVRLAANRSVLAVPA